MAVDDDMAADGAVADYGMAGDGAAGEGMVLVRCRICSGACQLDPGEFAVGRTPAVCPVCEGQLVVFKDAAGLVYVDTLVEGIVQKTPISMPISEPSGKPSNKTSPEPSSKTGSKPSSKQSDKTSSKPKTTPEANTNTELRTSRIRVVCPKCLKSYEVASDKISKNGAWVKCPNCSERFVVRKETQALFCSQDPYFVSIAASKKKTGSGKAKILSSVPIDLQVSARQDGFLKRCLGLAAIAMLILVFFIEGMVLSFSVQSAKEMVPESQSSFAKPIVYTQDSLIHDLKVLQRDTVSKGVKTASINYTGSASRVYKYAAGELAPGACTDITGLKTKSLDQAQGLTITATCFDPQDVPATFEVIWQNRSAMIYLSGRQRSGKSINVVIHSQ
jgi:predicted Zn finger-like uncharacterized protein